MPKRLAAALASLLMLVGVLAVVPIATAEPASAHPQTVRRCAYDPFAGNQCWNENVRHYHTPVQRNICPPGTTGTWPNCARPDTPAETENKNTGKSDGDGTEEPKPEQPKTEEPKAEEPETEEPKTEEPKTEEPKTEEPKTGEPETEEPKTEEPKTEEPKTEEPKTGEPKTEEPKTEQPTTTTTTNSDPCDTWHDNAVRVLLGPSNSDGLHIVDPVPSGCTTGAQRFAGWVKTHGDATAKKLRRLFETAMKAQADSAEGEIQASAELRKALKDILGNQYVQAAGGAVACGVLVGALIKSKGTVAKVPGWQKAVKHSSTGGCGAAVLYVENLLGKIPCVSVGSEGVNTGPRAPGDPLWCHDDQDGEGQDSGDGSGTENGGQQLNDPKPDADDGEDAPAATEPPKVTAEERSRAFLQMRRGEISYDQYREIRDRYRCQTTGQACNQ